MQITICEKNVMEISRNNAIILNFTSIPFYIRYYFSYKSLTFLLWMGIHGNVI